jgi:hypothetical protein
MILLIQVVRYAQTYHFDPLPCPEFDHYINLPASVDRHSPIAIFDLFFTPEQMQILVENTNKNGPFHEMGPVPTLKMDCTLDCKTLQRPAHY